MWFFLVFFLIFFLSSFLNTLILHQIWHHEIVTKKNYKSSYERLFYLGRKFFTSLLPPKSPNAAIHELLEYCPACHRWALNNSCFLRELREIDVPSPTAKYILSFTSFTTLGGFLANFWLFPRCRSQNPSLSAIITKTEVSKCHSVAYLDHFPWSHKTRELSH